MNRAVEVILYLLCALIIPPLAVGLYRGVNDAQFWINFILFLVFWPISIIHAIVIVCSSKPKVQEGSLLNIYPNQVQNNQTIPQQYQNPNGNQGYQVPYPETQQLVNQTTSQYPIYNEKQSVVNPAPPVNSRVPYSSSAPNNQRNSSITKAPPAYEEELNV